MNLKLFKLIHTERAYKRYYGQALPRDNFFYAVFYEIKSYINLFLSAAYLPFDKKYNTQQFLGERKSKFRMLIENITWALKYKEVCQYYFLFGLDLRQRKMEDYVAYTEFRVLRNILNIRQRENKKTAYTFNYLALTRDKFVFGQYAKSLGFPVPETIALISGKKISWFDSVGTFSDIEYLKSKNISGFCKECTGEGGKGAFILDAKDGKIFINNKEASIEELLDHVKDATYIIQRRITNHPIISNIYPNSVNTIRIVTVCKDNDIHVYDARLRTGANGSVVDNACFGGVVIGIKSDGTLTDWGYVEPGKTNNSNLVIKEFHPDTKFYFTDIQIPYWNELIDMVKRFHGYYYGIPSIGWDVAITPDGPIILECGEDWEIQGTQIFFGGRRNDFYDLHSDALKIKLRKY